MEEMELLLVLGLAGVVIYAGYKAKQAVTSAAPGVWDALKRGATNLENWQAGQLSPGLLMFDLGSGTTDLGNKWVAYTGAVLTVFPGDGSFPNGLDVGLSDQIGPQGRTAQQLLQDKWTEGDIADLVVMSGQLPVQAINEAASNAPPPSGTVTIDENGVFTWHP
jgi:hypothetical protein